MKLIYNKNIKNEKGDMIMKIIKRDGTIVDYNPEKIKIAIQKANNEVSGRERASEKQIKEIINYIEVQIKLLQNLVIHIFLIMKNMYVFVEKKGA